MAKTREFRRLQDAGVVVDDYDIQTILVDPPRAGALNPQPSTLNPQPSTRNDDAIQTILVTTPRAGAETHNTDRQTDTNTRTHNMSARTTYARARTHKHHERTQCTEHAETCALTNAENMHALTRAHARCTLQDSTMRRWR